MRPRAKQLTPRRNVLPGRTDPGTATTAKGSAAARRAFSSSHSRSPVRLANEWLLDPRRKSAGWRAPPSMASCVGTACPALITRPPDRHCDAVREGSPRRARPHRREEARADPGGGGQRMLGRSTQVRVRRGNRALGYDYLHAAVDRWPRNALPRDRGRKDLPAQRLFIRARSSSKS
jgi:hypothetical protein